MTDYLRECMESVGNPPIDAMTKNWCLHCAERGCERAGAKKLSFDGRVATWRERLFLNVPRADEEDPRYDNVRGRKFLPGAQSVGAAPPKTVIFMPGIPIVEPAEPRIVVPGRFVESRDQSAPEERWIDLPELQEESMPSPEAGGPEADDGEGTRSGASNTPFEQGAVLPGAPETPVTAAPAPRKNERGPGGVTFVLDDD